MINVDRKLLDKGLTANEFYILIQITRYINEKRTSYPSIKTLQKTTKLGRDVIYKTIKSLINKGFLKRIQKESGGKFTKTIYKITTNLLSLYNNAENEEIPFTDIQDTVSQPFTEIPYTENQDVLSIGKEEVLKKEIYKESPNEKLNNQLSKNVEIEKPPKEEKEKKSSADFKKEKEEKFEKFRKRYPATKGGFTVEFKNFQRHKDWMEVADIIEEKFNYEIRMRMWKEKRKEFVPEWANLSTWINQRRWEREYPDYDNRKQQSLIPGNYYDPKKDPSNISLDR